MIRPAHVQRTNKGSGSVGKWWIDALVKGTTSRNHARWEIVISTWLGVLCVSVWKMWAEKRTTRKSALQISKKDYAPWKSVHVVQYPSPEYVHKTFAVTLSACLGIVVLVQTSGVGVESDNPQRLFLTFWCVLLMRKCQVVLVPLDYPYTSVLFNNSHKLQANLRNWLGSSKNRCDAPEFGVSLNTVRVIVRVVMDLPSIKYSGGNLQ